MEIKKKNNPEKAWTEYISNLNEDIIIKSYEEKATDAMLKRIISEHSPKKILEVGCSNGRWLTHILKIADYKVNVYGVDIHSCGFKTKKIKFKIGDAKNLPYKNKEFDMVFSLGLLEHFSREDREKIMSEQIRVLKRQGILYNQIPNVSKISIEMYRIKLIYEYMLKSEYHYVFNPSEIKEYMEKWGDALSHNYIGKFRDIHIAPTNRVFASSYGVMVRKGSKC